MYVAANESGGNPAGATALSGGGIYAANTRRLL
jgi:hypothetical protein